MSDPMTVITSAQAVVAAIKQGAALAKKAGNQEVYAILLDAQEQTLDLREEVLSLRTEGQELRAENVRLEEALELQAQVKYEENAYWRDVDGDRDGPFCLRCRDVDKTLVRLTLSHSDFFHCPHCDKGFHIPSGPGAGPPPPPQRPPDIY